MKRFTAILLILVLSFSFTACGIDISALDTSDTELQVIEIVPGSTAVSIGEQLQAAGIIKDAKAFKKFAKNEGYDVRFQAGTYQFSSSYDLAQICDILVGGKVATQKFTIPEGLTLKETAKKLEEQGMGSYENYMDVISHVDDWKSDYPFLNDPGVTSLEGFLFPNTYEVPVGYTEKQIVDFLLQQFKKYALDELTNTSDSLSFYDHMIIASIVEKECKKRDEGPLVASVIYNRLDKGMLLQMDSTINYVIKEETGEVKEVILYSDLEKDSPYNTYKYPGLPVGPICSPGIDAIKSACDPADTDYLYFVVSGKLDGSSNFSSNYSDFAKDVQEYDKALTEKHNQQ